MTCTCPEDDGPGSHHTNPECPLFTTCGGWRLDPPCGGCDACCVAQAVYYRMLEAQEKGAGK